MDIYYFNGSSGCERCKDATGYSFELPERPHFYCDCAIELVDAEGLECEFEFRNVLWLDSEDEIEQEEIVDNCSETSNYTLIVQGEEDEYLDGDEDLKNQALALGWAEPELTGETQFSIEIPAGSAAFLTKKQIRFSTTFLADIYRVCTLPDGEQSDEYVSAIDAEWGKTISVDVEFEIAPCAEA